MVASPKIVLYENTQADKGLVLAEPANRVVNPTQRFDSQKNTEFKKLTSIQMVRKWTRDLDLSAMRPRQ